MMASASVAQEVVPAPRPQPKQCEGFNFALAPQESVARKAPASRAENEPQSLDFTLAFEPYGALQYSNLPLGSEVYQAFEFTFDNCELYEGKKITSVNIFSGRNSRSGKNGITNVNVFFAEDLDATPFITKAGKLGNDPFTQYKIVLDEPYVIEKGKPFFVGFSCKPLSDYDNYIVVDGIPRAASDGGWTGTKQAGQTKVTWDGSLPQAYGNICMGVTIEGEDLPQNGVSLYGVQAPVYVEPGKPFNFVIGFVGAAANDANSVDFEYTIGSQAPETVHIDFERPIGFNGTIAYNIPNAVCNEVDPSVPFSVKITKVNGEDNVSQQNVGGTTLRCFPADKGFAHTFMVEEFTGTWCGWCPSGIVMMEYLKEKYPDSVVRIAIHSGSGNQTDRMQVSSTRAVLNNYCAGFPQAVLDRSLDLSPTVDGVLSEIDEYYAENKDIPSIAEISDLSAEFTVGKTIEINATAKFAVNLKNDNRYRLAYYLTEDGLGPFDQHNYYSGGSMGAMGGWESKGEWVSTVYEDVARLLVGSVTGVSGSLPAEIVGGEACLHTTTASTSLVMGDKFFLTAMIFDNQDGYVVNCKQIEVTRPAGIADAAAGDVLKVRGAEGCISFVGEYSAAAVYNIAGQLVATATGETSVAVPAGLYIVKADGVSAKVAVK